MPSQDATASGNQFEFNPDDGSGEKQQPVTHGQTQSLFSNGSDLDKFFSQKQEAATEQQVTGGWDDDEDIEL